MDNLAWSLRTDVRLVEMTQEHVHQFQCWLKADPVGKDRLEALVSRFDHGTSNEGLHAILCADALEGGLALAHSTLNNIWIHTRETNIGRTATYIALTRLLNEYEEAFVNDPNEVMQKTLDRICDYQQEGSELVVSPRVRILRLLPPTD